MLHPSHLAALVDAAGGLDSRKRVQKAVYLLQSAGCELGAEYYLHHYGPYSVDVARSVDELAKAGVLEERREMLGNGGRKYRYDLTDSGRDQLRGLEATPAGDRLLGPLRPFLPLAKDLAARPPRPLDLASTVAFFRDRGDVWETAAARAFEYKDEPPGSADAAAAVELARQVEACRRPIASASPAEA